MKNHWGKRLGSGFLAILMAVTLVMGLQSTKVKASNGLTSYDITVTYGQTEARSMLTRINQLRTSSTESWYWNSDNKTKTSGAVAALTYDYELEKVAMLRAAEIAYKYSHDRPNGNDCFTAYPSTYLYSACGENIAMGQSTATIVEEDWEEEDENYDGQGHRRNLLNSDYVAVGIGHVTYNGVNFWVQEFSETLGSTSVTTANDSKTTVTLEVQEGSSPENHGYSYSGGSGNHYCSNNDHDWVVTYSEIRSKNERFHTIYTESYCSKCDANTVSTSTSLHSYTWKVTKEATETTEGSKTGTCSVCGYQTTVTIPSTGSSSSGSSESENSDSSSGDSGCENSGCKNSDSESYDSDDNISYVTDADDAGYIFDWNDDTETDFYMDDDGNIRAYDYDGNQLINTFACDGTYTYYFQADGTAMKDRLTYHPDGVHVIYFDEDGHEVFSDFHHISTSIAGDSVDDECFFDVYGYMYVDVLTYDKTGTYLLYANPYGRLECDGWFQFSDTVVWADGTPCDGIAGGYGYARSNCRLRTDTLMIDWEGRLCYLQGNGVALY